MAGRDPERIAESLRKIADGSLLMRIPLGSGCTAPAALLAIAADEMDRMREYLLETSGRLHQIATDHSGLSGSDLRALANDMCRMANRRDDQS